MNVLGWWLASWIVLAILSLVWIAKKPSYETPGMERVRGFGTKAGFLPCFTFSVLFFVVAAIMYFVMSSRLDAQRGSINLPTTFGAGGTPKVGPATSPSANPFASPSPTNRDESAAPPGNPVEGNDEGPKPGTSTNPFL